jgi:CRISPR-associated exonuclease Cas4
VPSAGQVEQFAYCAHNWWLARAGEEGRSQASERGLRAHKELGEVQAAIEGDKREEREDYNIATRFVGLAASLALLVLTLVLGHNLTLERQLTLATLGLVMVSASAAIFIFGLLAHKRHLARQAETKLVPGNLISSDLAGQAPIMVDPAWDLTGRPDYLLSTRDGPVPVEVKTGRTPARPFESHVLQLACYLRLVEAQNAKAPAYGVVQYPDGVFRVEWDAALAGRLRAILDRMAAAQVAGRADRDHEEPGRCRGCSRRGACEQRLA